MPNPEEPKVTPEIAEIRKNEKSWIQIAQEAADGLRAESDILQVPVYRSHADGNMTLLMTVPMQPLNDADIEAATRAATPRHRTSNGRVEPGETNRMELRFRLIVASVTKEAREGLFGKAMQDKFGVQENWEVVPYIFRAGESQQLSDAIDKASSYLSEEQRRVLVGN